ADVPVAIDVDAERVLVLCRAREQVAALEDAVDVEAEAAERPTGELEQVAPAEEVIEVDAAFYGRVLEERVGIVPGAKLRGGASETRGELRVEGALPACERLRRCSVRLLECRGQLRLVHLVRLEREREPVA